MIRMCRRLSAIMAWVVLSATPLLAGNAQHGETLYQRYCSGCHGADGRGGGKGFMPHVGALTRKGYIDLIDDASLSMVIAEGGEAMGKSGFMPSWKATLSKDDIADVIAYVRTLPLSDGPQGRTDPNARIRTETKTIRKTSTLKVGVKTKPAKGGVS